MWLRALPPEPIAPIRIVSAIVNLSFRHLPLSEGLGGCQATLLSGPLIPRLLDDTFLHLNRLCVESCSSPRAGHLGGGVRGRFARSSSWITSL
jgi:hypothetical protein